MSMSLADLAEYDRFNAAAQAILARAERQLAALEARDAERLGPADLCERLRRTGALERVAQQAAERRRWRESDPKWQEG